MSELAFHDRQGAQAACLPGGVELHFIEQGKGAPVILLHGGMGDCHSWATQAHVLSQRFRVIAYSRRHSFPNTNPLGPVKSHLGQDTEDLGKLQCLLKVGPAHLVGTSYGATVALAFALEHPGHVLSLVLAEPPLHRWACRTSEGARLYANFLRRVWRPARRAFALGHDSSAVQLLTDGIWNRPVFHTLPALRAATALRNAPAMRALTQAARPFSAPSRTAVARLAHPTLLVNGELSSALHRHVVDELVLAMPWAGRAVIKGAGHGAPAENPTEFNAAVMDFLP